MKLVDSTFIIDLLNGEEGAVVKAQQLDEEEHEVYTTEVSVFEVVLEIFGSKKMSLKEQRLLEAQRVFERFQVLPLDHPSAIAAAKIAGELMLSGQKIDDTDCMIAGIAFSNQIPIVITRNVDHFERIKGIKVEEY